MQPLHETEKFWPAPMGQGVLVELEFAKVDTKIILKNGNLRNLPSAWVRAVSPHLPQEIKDKLMPDGQKAGDVGRRFIISEGNLNYVDEAAYEAAGLTIPTEENRLGDLAHISYDKIIAMVPEDGDLTESIPMGGRVFFEYDFDDESLDEHETDGGILVREKDLALENQLATVTKVGPLVEEVGPGDRIVAPMQTQSITVEGENYPYVDTEHEIIALLVKAGEERVSKSECDCGPNEACSECTRVDGGEADTGNLAIGGDDSESEGNVYLSDSGMTVEFDSINIKGLTVEDGEDGVTISSADGEGRFERQDDGSMKFVEGE